MTYPPLPYAAWEDSKNTLHLYAQVVGKVRMALTPRRNHWWHVPLYVSARGLTTTTIPYHDMTFTVDFDFVEHALVIRTSRGDQQRFPLQDGLSVAQFYTQFFAALDTLGIDVTIHAVPFDHKSTIPFAQDETHNSYDPDAVHRYWQVLMRVDAILKAFAARFTGKASPVHLFWHSFDLAMTRFSGEPAPALPDADPVTQDAYSHEVISFGWWAGDPHNPFPAFYSYTYPEPDNLPDQPLQPDAAYWQTSERGSLALLKYEDMRASDDPTQAALDFYESAYRAGCMCAGWDIEKFAYTW